MKLASIVMAAAAAVSTVTGAHLPAPTGADILNLALQLECLEAEFYSFASYGVGLTEAQRGGGPPPIGGKKANLDGPYAKIAKEIADDEIAHVELLRAALGDAAVPCPLIDIGPAFAAAANAAAGTTLVPTFDPYANELFFLHGAFIFEDVGVTAYGGAVEPLAGLVDGATLSVAARILAVEAYHAGIVRDQLYYLETEGVVTPYGPISTVVQLISDLRDAVDGSSDLDQGIVAADGSTTLVPTDANALTFLRDISQVLAIVYLGSADTPGGFFPEGINGRFGPDYMPPAMAPTDSMMGACALRYEQCGGKNWTGATCCAGNSECVMTNEFYSGCRPGAPMAGVVPFYKKCSMDDGAMPCEEGSTCIKKKESFSQCVPDM